MGRRKPSRAGSKVRPWLSSGHRRRARPVRRQSSRPRGSGRERSMSASHRDSRSILEARSTVRPALTDATSALTRTSGASPCRPLPYDCVVIVSPFFWNFRDDIPGTTQHVASVFASWLPTIFLEPPVAWNPRSNHFRIHRLARAVCGPAIRKPRPGLTVFHRRTTPLGRYGAIRARDASRCTSTIRTYLRDRGFRKVLLWHSFPYSSEFVIDTLEHTTLVYHSLDHCSMEEDGRIARRADVVFCVSEGLVAKHGAVNPNTFLLPNGVDLALFDPARISSLDRPRDLPSDRAIIGFLGVLNSHVDFSLLVCVAQAFPERHVAIVGKLA